jgi:hypothetical protein
MSEGFLNSAFSAKPLMAFGFALLAAIGVWVMAAFQQLSGDEAKHLLSNISEVSRKVVVEQPDFIQSLRQMNVADLRKIVGEVGRDMRLFQAESDARVREITDRQMQSARSGLAHDDFVKNTNEIIAWGDSQTFRFQTELRPKVLALRDEIVRRTGIPFNPTADRRSRPLDFGQLVGPQPLNSAADYLEEFARKL